MRTREAAPAAEAGAAPAASHGAWILRATARLPGSPLAQGLVLATLLLAAELLASVATPPARRLDFAWFRILALPLLSGYLLVALHAIVAAGARALTELAPVLAMGPAERAGLARTLRAPPRAAAVAAAAVGVGIPLGVALMLPEVRAGAARGHPQLLAFGAMAALFWWLTAQGVALLLLQARRFHDLALASLRVDLFDPVPLAPFGRLAVRNALVVSGAVALGVALAATPDAQAAWLLRIEVARGVGLLALFLAAGVACGLTALALPLLGVHRRLRGEKAAALARLAGALPSHDDATRNVAGPSGGAGAEPTRTAALLAMRDALEAAPEWPLDASMLRRFGLYALLPAASWLLRLALEEGVGRALG